MRQSKRDEFSSATKKTLAERVAYCCSNPECGRKTVGPNSNSRKSSSIGEAAHIHSAAPNGPRYDPSMTSEERAAVENGIWLCKTCARLIDVDVEKYTTEILYEWKRQAEQKAEEEISSHFQKSKRMDALNHNNVRNVEKHWLRNGLVLLVFLIGVFYPFYHLVFPFVPFSLVPRIVYFFWILFGAFWIWNRIETRPNVAGMCYETITEADLNSSPAQLYSRLISMFGKKYFVSGASEDGFVCYYRFVRLEFGSWDGQRINYLNITFKRSLKYYDPSFLYLHTLSYGSQAVKMLSRQGFILQQPLNPARESIDCLKKEDIQVFLYYKRNRLYRAIALNCNSDATLKRLPHSKKYDAVLGLLKDNTGETNIVPLIIILILITIAAVLFAPYIREMF